MENFINEKENEEIQKIYNPNEENEEHIYEINKKLYLSNAFISLGKKGPISSFHQLNSGKLVSIKKISNAFENPLKAKKRFKTDLYIILCKSSKYCKIIRYNNS